MYEKRRSKGRMVRGCVSSFNLFIIRDSSLVGGGWYGMNI